MRRKRNRNGKGQLTSNAIVTASTSRTKKSHDLKNLLIQIFRKFRCETLENFRVLTHTSITNSEKTVAEAYASANAVEYDDPEEQQAHLSHLEGEFWEHGQVREVTGSMLIMGLYHQVETHIRKVALHTFPKTDGSSLLRGDSGCGVDCKKLKGFAALDELRQINNAIKHNGAVVTKALSTLNPAWAVKTELCDLDLVFDRLKPQIIEYVSAFVHEAFMVSAEFDPAPVTALKTSPVRTSAAT